MPKRTSAYAPWLAGKLKDPRVAVDYLRASATSPEGLLKALRKVAEAHRVSKIAEAAELQRESVYHMLSEDGNPRLDSLWGILHAMGLRISVVPIVEDQTTGDITEIDTELGQGTQKIADGNSLSGGGDNGETLDQGMATVPVWRKGPGRALDNFAYVGHSMITERTGDLLGR
jgi:probable addiction module antidote protein